MTELPPGFVGAALAERRARSDGFVAAATEPAGVSWAAVDAGGVEGLWAVPEEPTAGRVVQYLHGGGYVSGSSASHRRLGGHLARATGARVLLVDYARAPERPHPGALEDSVAVYRWLLESGTAAPGELAVAGDSSGGGLALATALKARDSGLPLPAAVAALSAWADLDVRASLLDGTDDRVVSVAGLGELAEVFLAGADPRDPYASPLHADLSGLCPVYLQVGGDEVLLTDSQRFAAKAAAAGVDVELDVVPGMQHVFQMRVGNLPEATDAVARLASWLRRCLTPALETDDTINERLGQT
jgi:acetyl esterase/lipase